MLTTSSMRDEYAREEWHQEQCARQHDRSNDALRQDSQPPALPTSKIQEEQKPSETTQTDDEAAVVRQRPGVGRQWTGCRCNAQERQRGGGSEANERRGNGALDHDA
jgi:hypothetical protein